MSRRCEREQTRVERIRDHQAFDLVVIGGVVGLSFLIGPPLVGAIVSAFGVNLLTPKAEAGWDASRRRLFGTPDPVNHDIELALRRSFQTAIGRLKTDWFETHRRGTQLYRARKRDPGPYEEAVGLFEILGDGVAQVLTLDRLRHIAGTPAAIRLLDGGAEQTRRTLIANLSACFHGHDEQLVNFLGDRLLDALAFCFAEDLKIDKPEQNRSWRAFQRLMLSGLTDSVATIQTQQAEIAEGVAKLTAWAERLAALPEEIREPTGEIELTDLLQTRHKQVLDAVREEGEATRREIWDIADLLDEAIRRDGDRTRALIVMLHGQAPARPNPPRQRQPNGLPPIWNVPHQRNPNFTGRARLLASLAGAVAAQGAAALVQALHGLGGVGKTQLAVEFAYRYAARYDWSGGCGPNSA